MNLQSILNKVKGVRGSVQGTGFTAYCPAHDDKKQSLKVDQGDGKMLLNCFAGCSTESIIKALGIEWKDLFDSFDERDLKSHSGSYNGVGIHAPAKKKIVNVYRYTDEKGQLLYENCRMEPKEFKQRHYDSKKNIRWNLTGVPRVPYRLPDLVDKVRYGSDVWLAEGEKDADTLRELGFVATSFKNWQKQFNKYLEKTNVIICRDHDTPGGVQAEEAARLISETAASVKVLDVYADQDMPDKHGPDVSDYVRYCVQDEGMTREEIAERLCLMADGAQRWVDTSVTGPNLFLVKTGNQWIADAKARPSPKRLFGDFWYQGELCILFADTNVGKSILAVQIGDIVSRGRSADTPVRNAAIGGRTTVGTETSGGYVDADKSVGAPFTTECPPQKVVYFDFELTDKQFESRVSTRVEGSDRYTDHYQFSDNFSRAEVNPETSDLNGFSTFEEFLNFSLDRTIVREHADVLIIDNLTYLRDETENARNALPLMKYLKELKSRHGISILALAHTPKRDITKPLGRNDLQGSKMLINFCDSSFAIGESQKEEGVRYLKQIKARNTAIVYHSENVMLATVEKQDKMLRFVFSGAAIEREHLKAFSDKDRVELIERAKGLQKQGLSLAEIARALHISKATAGRYVHVGESVSEVSDDLSCT